MLMNIDPRRCWTQELSLLENFVYPDEKVCTNADLGDPDRKIMHDMLSLLKEGGGSPCLFAGHVR